MKKLLIVVLIFMITLGLVGCSSSENTTSDDNADEAYHNADSYNPDNYLSESEKGELAEEAAMEKVYEYLSKIQKFAKYDIDSSKYKVSNIDSYGSSYTVKGEIYLYDKYGYLEDTATFSCTVKITAFGEVSSVGVPDITIK